LAASDRRGVGDVRVVGMRRHPDSCVVVLAGELTRRAASWSTRALAAPLHDVGRVLVDVSRLTVGWAAAVDVFAAVLTSAGGWPHARLVLFGASDALRGLLDAVRVPERVHLALDETAARAALEVRPPAVARVHDLPADVTAPRLARTLVGSACHEWGVDDALEDAELVVSELVTNAVEHARSASRLTLTADGRGLTVALRDRDPGRLEVAPSIEREQARGRGLFVAAAVSRAWGVTQHADGKTVWTLLPAGGADDAPTAGT
jgi:anti-sigma regulatory factor (Ser/Thr protein kinase)